MSNLAINNFCKTIEIVPICQIIGSGAIPLALTTIGAIGLAVGCKIYWHWHTQPTAKADTFNLDVDKEYNRCGLEVLRALDAPGNVEEKLQTFKNFTGSIKRSGVRYNESLPIWGKLAEKYLEIAKGTLTTPTQLEEVNYFINELQERAKSNTTTYEWFSLFCDRLTILMSDPKLRGVATTDDLIVFDFYRMNLERKKEKGIFCWLTHDSYLRACNEVGEKHTIDRYSPAALCKRLFPNVVMMPFPFDLDCSTIVLSFPELGENASEDENLWLLGFVKKPEIADDILFSPSRFYMHDQFHLLTYLSLLSFEINFYPEGSESPISHLIKNWQGLALTALKKMKEIIRTSKIGDEKLINSFLAFILFHEKIDSLPVQLNRVVEMDQNQAKSLTGLLHDFEGALTSRFAKLLPIKVIEQAGYCRRAKPSINWELLSQYAASFVSLFQKDPEFIKQLSSEIEKFNKLSSDFILIDCPLQEEFPFYAASGGILYSKLEKYSSTAEFKKLETSRKMTNGIIIAPLIRQQHFHLSTDAYESIHDKLVEIGMRQ